MSKVWFITGASSGFGRLTAEICLKNGDAVVATLRKPEVLDDLKAQYPATRLLVLKLDVKNAQEITDAFSRAKEVFGRLDVVLNNAGTGFVGEIESTPDHMARSVVETDFWGAANVSREAVKFFREVNKPVGGRLLTVGSFGGLTALLCAGYYTAAKHGTSIFRL
ncbi:hypothetical protein PHLCEN_2v12240 [Hermanssonia centrifuga]|uniref:NAD(P)-binding protein n=1 Tax=Hermanssonia centrifuga TaxID=98765 RepID=A0A2R6NHM7_9APHY|nr:hypothetical protein PHLCEN_2v12240 [Hermanssonia centrifuga]